MCNQTKEAARQILGELSDMQAVISMSGSNELNLKLAAIREKAAFLLEGGKGPEQIVASYRNEAQDSLIFLGELIELHYGARNIMDDADLLQALRLAEIFVTRMRVYFDRKRRYQFVAHHSKQVQEETNAH